MTPLPTPRRLALALGETVLGCALMALVSLGVQWFIGRLPIPRPSHVASSVIMIVAAIAMLVILGMVATTRWRRWFLPLAWLVLSAASTTVLAAVLHGTKYYLGGISVDQGFRTEYLTRLTSSPDLADYAYQHLAPYYPAAWYWLGGRFADLAGMPGWSAYKPYSIITIAALGALVFALWSLTVRRPVALLLTTVTGVFALAVAAAEPYSFVAVVSIPPVAALAWRLLAGLRASMPDPRSSRYAVAVAIGIAAGVYGACYTLFFGFMALLLVVFAAATLVIGHRRSRQEPDGPDAAATTPRLLGRIAGHGVLVALPALLVAATAWAPYLIDAAGPASGPSMAARYLPGGSSEFPTPFLDFSVQGALSLIGLGWLVFASYGHGKYRGPARALAATVATCYLWYLLSQLALAVNTTLLAFRIGPLLDITLLTAATLAALDLLPRLLARLPAHRKRPGWTLACLLALAVLVGRMQGFPDAVSSSVHSALNDYYPTGHTAQGTANPADKDSWVPRLNSGIRELTGRGPRDDVVLSDSELLVDTSPYWRFQTETPHYANPLGDYPQRSADIRAWSHAHDSAQLLAELRDCRHDAPTVFVLSRSGDTLTYQLGTGVFPHSPNVVYHTISFRRSLFSGPGFVTRDVGPYTVAVRTDAVGDHPAGSA